MELTLDQALQKGIEAHKSGKAQEADRYYTAILKANPKHPDANHNMGVLAVGVGKVEQALPFFNTAVEVKPNVAQYWLSYIDALIRLEKLDDAKTILDQAKSKGAKGDGFDQVEIRLANVAKVEDDKTYQGILGKAIDLRETGKYDEAIYSLLNQTKQSPTDPNILSVLSHCYILNDNLKQAKIYLDAAKDINPNMPLVGWNEARLFLKQNKVKEALAVAQRTNKLFPDDVEGMGVLGSCLRVNGNFDESLKYLNKAIELNPNYAEILINRGLIYVNKKDNANALPDLEKAHTLKPHIKEIWHLVLNLKMEANDFENTIALAREMVRLDPVDEIIFATIALCYQHLKTYEDAVIFYKKALFIRPDYADAYSNMGTALRDQGKLDEAIEAYKKALAIKPDYPEVYNNMGVALKDQGKLDEAIEAYTKALSNKPDSAVAYYNMGNVLQEQGKLDEAIEACKKALSIKPSYAEAYNNMGNALYDLGKLDEAIEAFNKAISINPNYAEAFSNMGNTFVDQGKLEEAIKAYNKAISIKPDFAQAYWNLSGTAKNITEAKKYVAQCRKTNPNHLEAKLTLSAFHFYEGDKSEFNSLIKSPLKEHALMRSFAWAFNLPKLPPLHFHRWALFDHMISLSKADRPFYEFGVWRGEAFRYLIKTFKKGYGFDTFEGLPEDWHNNKVGTYSSDGNIPKIVGGEFIVGKFENTLPDFFAENRPKASIINFDADLYSSTICALDFSKPVIDQHTILIFDEFIINDNWEQDEYKALEEFCNNNDYTYEVLAISFYTKQVAVKIIGI